MTFGAQGTYILPGDPEQGRYMFMADRWTRGKIGESRYVWLPLVVRNDGEVAIQRKDR